MFIISDRVKETTTSTGQGSIVLNGALGAFQTFSNGIGDGNTTYYTIENNSRWEVGQGVYTASSNSLSRDIVFDSSDGGGKISLEGVSIVFCTLPASKAFIRDPNESVRVNNIMVSGDANVDDLFTNTITNSGNLNVGQDALISGDLNVLGNFNYDGSLTIDNINVSGDIISSGFLTLVRNGEGNFFHAYKNDGTNQTVSLYVDENISPLWKLGLKTNPNDQTAEPTFAYVYGRDGLVGLVSNNSNFMYLSDSLGFTVVNDSHLILRATSDTGVYIDARSTTNPALTLQGAPLTIADLQVWEDSTGSTLSVVDSGGKFGILNAFPLYELDVDGSGKMDTLTLTSGIYFPDGSFQNTALLGSVDQIEGVSGIAVYASGLAVQNEIDIAAVSGWADQTMTNRDTAISGYFQAYVDGQDHSAIAVSGWAESYIGSVSGNLQDQISSNDIDINAVSGIAVFASGHNLQTVTDNGAVTDNEITINANFSAVSGSLSGIDFTPLSEANYPPHQEGRIFFDAENHTLTMYGEEPEISLQIGQEEHLRIRNTNSYTIANGSGVYLTGSQGTHPTVDYAIASGEDTSHVVGLATHDIEPNSFGYITTYGIVRNVDTSAFSDGDELYLSAEHSGVLVNVSPIAPNYKSTIGHVIRSHPNNGTILVANEGVKLGGGDAKTLGNIGTSGIAFFESVTPDGNAGILASDANFYYDSGNDRLHIGAGGIRFNDGTTQTTAGGGGGGGNRTYNNITSDFSMSDDSDVVFMDTTSGPVNVYLPTALAQGGKEIMVKLKAGTNSGVLIASGAQTIDGQSLIAVYNTYESVTLISDNSNWFIS